MDGSKATRSTTVREAALDVVDATHTTINQRNTSHPSPDRTNLNIDVPRNPDLTHPLIVQP